MFLRPLILPFHRFLYSRRSVTPIGLNFGHDLYPDISFLAKKEGIQPTYGVSTRVRVRPLLGNVVISKKILRTCKIMVMHSNERGECCARTFDDPQVYGIVVASLDK